MDKIKSPNLNSKAYKTRLVQIWTDQVHTHHIRKEVDPLDTVGRGFWATTGGGAGL